MRSRDWKLETGNQRIKTQTNRVLAGLVSIALVILVSHPVIGGDVPGRGGDLSTVTKALNNAKEMEKQIVVPKVAKSNKAAKQAAKTYYSSEYQARLHKEIERLKRGVFHHILKDEDTEEARVSSPSAGNRYFLMPDERIYIFISSSVPIETLRSYAEDLDRLRDPNISMVMRGFVGGIKYFKPTLEFLEKVLARDPECDFTTTQCDAFRATVNIDPLVFRRYRVKQVPAILYVRGLSLVDAGLSEGITENAPIGEAYMVRGDVSLEYALEKIRKRSGSSQLEEVVRQLTAGFYSERRKAH